jgi:uncharacterized protein YuzE
MKETRYFTEDVRERRPYIKDAWLRRALEEPEYREVQLNGRIRHWIYVEVLEKYLRSDSARWRDSPHGFSRPRLRSRSTPLLNAMQLRHYPETDTLYVAFREAVSVESEEVSPGVVADFDEDGRVIGFEVEDASNQMDLSSLQAFSLPANALGLLLGAGVVLL